MSTHPTAKTIHDAEILEAETRLTDGVLRTLLPNGLTVLIKENHTSPVAAILVSVRAGYFQEADRISGIAHVIEHMIFKGTPLRPDNEQFAREIRELGGTLNAATYYEETYYYVIVPSQNTARALEIQADALQNALYDPEELSKEIEVIVQESLQKRDNPMAMLNESLYELAYDTHRIRRWRIGHPDPLRAITHEDIAAFVRATYRPGNMVVTVVGDINAAQALEDVKHTWGALPSGDMRRETSPPEPVREGFRYRRLTGDQRQRLLLFHLPAPPLLHPDAAPLTVLSAVLSDGRSARLYRRLREELRIANSAWTSYETFEQMGLFKIGAESISDDPLPVEQALWAEIRRLQEEPVSEEELDRVKTRVESGRLYGQEEVFGMARALTSYELVGDYHLADRFTAQLHAVTAEDLLRVARHYFQLPLATLIEYLPTISDAPERTTSEVEEALRRIGDSEQETSESEERTETLGNKEESNALNKSKIKTPTPASGYPHPKSKIPRLDIEPARRILLPNGGTLAFRPRRDLPIVAVQALFHGGKSLESHSICGRTNLMLKSSLKGTRSLSATEIANRIEALGSGIGASAGPDYFGYGFKVRRDHLDEAFSIFSEVLAYPAFPEEEVEREKQAISGEIRRQQDSSMSLAYEMFASAYFGAHPYGLPSIGIEEAVAAQKPEDLREWHARLLSPANLVGAVVGDLEEEEAVALFSRLFPERVGGEAQATGVVFAGPEPPSERSLTRQKRQTAAAMGFMGANLTSEDRYALDVLDEITSAMGGRFFRAVRGDNALAYSVSSVHRSRRDAGNFITYTSTAPENELRAREILLRECARLGREPVTRQELETAKATLYGEQVIGTQTFGSQSSELAYYALNGLPLDEAERYLKRIQAVTAEEVMDVASRHLTPDGYWLGVVRGTSSES